MGLMTAQERDGWYEQWQRAKFGHSLRMEEARQTAASEGTVRNDQPAEVTGCGNVSIAKNVAGTSNSWYEQWHLAKFGRNSTMEDGRQTGENRCPDIPVSKNLQGSNNSWHTEWGRAKFGHRSITGQVRQSAEGPRT